MARTIHEAFADVGIAAPPPPAPEISIEPQSCPVDGELRFLLDNGLVTGSVVAFSRHAVQRYRERFEPDCDLTEAKRRLYARIHRARYRVDRPPWLVNVPTVGDPRRLWNVGFLVIDDEVVLPLRDTLAPALPDRHPPQPLTAVTTLYPTGRENP